MCTPFKIHYYKLPNEDSNVHEVNIFYFLVYKVYKDRKAFAFNMTKCTSGILSWITRTKFSLQLLLYLISSLVMVRGKNGDCYNFFCRRTLKRERHEQKKFWLWQSVWFMLSSRKHVQFFQRERENKLNCAS